jgi:hypothetical protein
VDRAVGLSAVSLQYRASKKHAAMTAPCENNAAGPSRRAAKWAPARTHLGPILGNRVLGCVCGG